MAEKNFNTRIIHKHDTEANWLKAENFIPKKGELIVYDKDVNYNYNRFKIGDGETFVNNLPFSVKQSDWKQSNETQPDYIKNKTHWEYQDILLPDTEINIVDHVCVIENFTFDIPNYEKYFITINGVDHEVTYSASSSVVQLSNKDNTIGVLVAYMVSQTHFGYPEDGTYTVSVRGETIHKLDKKFLPEQVQADWEQSDETQVDYIKNRPIYGPYETETVKVSEITVTTNEAEIVENVYMYGANLNDYAFEFNANIDTYYKINFNGTDYICQPWSGYTIYFIGNQAINNAYKSNGYVFDNGQPFLFITNWSGTWLTLYTKTAGEYTLSITEVTIDRKCLDRELLPFGYETDPDNNGAVILNGGLGVWSLGGGNVGFTSVSEGTSVAKGDYAHAEGHLTVATGQDSHAEGQGTFAEGNDSHAEGDGTIARGWMSHAEGCFTKASSEAQHVQGRYNIEDTNDVYAHIVGNGTNGAPSNAHTLDWDGNAWFAGNITLGENDVKVLSEADYISNEEIDEICNSYVAAREVLF